MLRYHNFKIINSFIHISRSCDYLRDCILTINLKTRFIERNFRFCSKLAACNPVKTDIENTNEHKLLGRSYYLNYLRNHSKYSDLFCLYNSPKEILGNSYYLEKLFNENCDPQTADDLEKLANILIEKLTSVNNNDLLELMTLIIKLYIKFENSEICFNLKQKLDSELCQRINSSTRDESFNFVKLLYPLKFKDFKYFYKIQFKLTDNFTCLSPLEIVKFFYLFPTVCYDKNKKFFVANHLFKNVPNFTCDEIGLICFTLSGKKNFFSHPDLLSAFIAKAEDNLDSINSEPLQHLCKAVYLFGSYHHFIQILKLQDKILPNISKLDASTSVFLLTSNMKYKNYNITLAEKVIEKIKGNINECNFEVISRLMLFMCRFNIQDQELMNLVLQYLNSNFDKTKLEEYSKILKILNCFMFNRIYPSHILNSFMKKETIYFFKTRGSFNLLCLWNHLHFSLIIEKPEFACKDVDEKLKKLFKKILNIQLKKNCSSSYFKLNRHIEKDLIKLYGSENFAWIKPLPHYLPLLILHLDKSQCPQPIPEEMKRMHDDIYKAPHDSDDIWICFITLHKSDFSVHEETRSVKQLFIRQFEICGYTPIEVLPELFKKEYGNGTSDVYIKDLVTKKLEKVQNQKM